MIFVTVSENDSADTLTVLDEVRNVGNDDVHAEELGFGEHQSGVDDDDVVAPAHGHAVHTELAQTSEGNDLQFSSGHGVKMMLARASTQYPAFGSGCNDADLHR